MCRMPSHEVGHIGLSAWVVLGVERHGTIMCHTLMLHVIATDPWHNRLAAHTHLAADHHVLHYL